MYFYKWQINILTLININKKCKYNKNYYLKLLIRIEFILVGILLNIVL